MTWGQTQKKPSELSPDVINPSNLVQFLLTPFQNQLEDLYSNSILDLSGERMVLYNLTSGKCSGRPVEIYIERRSFNKEKNEKLVIKDCAGELFWVVLNRVGEQLAEISVQDWMSLKFARPEYLENLESFRMEISQGNTKLHFKKNVEKKTWMGHVEFVLDQETIEMNYYEVQKEFFTQRVFYFTGFDSLRWDGYLIARSDVFSNYESQTFWMNRYQKPISKKEFKVYLWETFFSALTKSYLIPLFF